MITALIFDDYMELFPNLSFKNKIQLKKGGPGIATLRWDDEG